MPKRVVIGVVTRDKAPQTRRVEIPRLVRHATYGKTMRRRTICYAHDEQNISHMGDTVEIEIEKVGKVGNEIVALPGTHAVRTSP